MDKGLQMVIGMSLAYVTSFAGLILAYVSYKKHHKKKETGTNKDGQSNE